MAILKVLCWALIFIIKVRFPPGQSLADGSQLEWNVWAEVVEVNTCYGAYNRWRQLEISKRILDGKQREWITYFLNSILNLFVVR